MGTINWFSRTTSLGGASKNPRDVHGFSFILSESAFAVAAMTMDDAMQGMGSERNGGEQQGGIAIPDSNTIIVKKKGRAREPPEFADVVKTCPFCESTDCQFKFLNNGKKEQPRYKCLFCEKIFTYNPNGRKKHPLGYKKRGKELPEDLQDMTLVCPNCEGVNNSKFLYYNKSKVTRARFQCIACEVSYTPGERARRTCKLAGGIVVDDGGEGSAAKVEKLNVKRKPSHPVDAGEGEGAAKIAKLALFKETHKRGRKPCFEETEFSDCSDASDDDEDEVREWIEKKRQQECTSESSDDDDSDDDSEEPADSVHIMKRCNWCPSSNTVFVKFLNGENSVLEYQCQDCGMCLRFDTTSNRVLPKERRCQSRKYNLR